MGCTPCLPFTPCSLRMESVSRGQWTSLGPTYHTIGTHSPISGVYSGEASFGKSRRACWQANRQQLINETRTRIPSTESQSAENALAAVVERLWRNDMST